jgi:hypothetical protein
LKRSAGSIIDQLTEHLLTSYFIYILKTTTDLVDLINNEEICFIVCVCVFIQDNSTTAIRMRISSREPVNKPFPLHIVHYFRPGSSSSILSLCFSSGTVSKPLFVIHFLAETEYDSEVSLLCCKVNEFLNQFIPN